MRKLRLRQWLSAGVAALCFAPGTLQSGSPQAAEPTRIITGVPSAERLLDDLRWIVGDLAGDQETWDETLQPAAEVFLIGVDPSRPVGTDVVFDREGGQRKQFNIPISNLQEFREENLEPIDIQSSRKAPDYYKLTSDALGYEGWMRYLDNYASISTKEQDVPSGMPSPMVALDKLLKESGYDAGLTATNNSDGIADRRDAFQEFRENMLAGISRRPSETPEAFELRKRLAHHQTERLERLFVEAEQVLGGWITDAKKEEARGEMLLSALAGTDLAKALGSFGATASHFAAIPTTEASLVHGRMNIPVDPTLQNQADEFYKLVAPVWKQRIDGDESLTAEQKAARHKICDLGLEMLNDGRALKALDAFIEIAPSASGKNTLLTGIRAADGTKAVALIEQIPAALSDLTLELNVDKAGDLSIHKFKMSKVPEALKSFYGEGSEVYVATGKDAVWIAAGDGALDLLKQQLQLVAESKPEANGDVFVGRVKLGPVLKHLDDLGTEVGFDLNKFLGRAPAAETESDDSSKKNPGQALMSLDLRKLALPTLQEGNEDHFSLHVKKADKKVRADVKVERGVLKAAGKVIAKVAAERLSG
ncbi:MAG: hypothetical protein ACK5Q5_20645 [Planctomycetaceae bacterium]